MKEKITRSTIALPDAFEYKCKISNKYGDMYEQEEKFFAFAEKRTPEKIEDWLKTLSHKVIRLDGTKPIQENVELIKSLLLWEKGDRDSGG